MKRTRHISGTGASSANSLCRQIGHAWDEGTISPTYRRCVRSQCTAAKRLLNGAWIAVETTARRASHQAATQQQQSMLFAPPPVGLPTRDEERRAEQRYYRLLGR